MFSQPTLASRVKSRAKDEVFRFGGAQNSSFLPIRRFFSVCVGFVVCVVFLAISRSPAGFAVAADCVVEISANAFGLTQQVIGPRARDGMRTKAHTHGPAQL